MTNSNKPHVHAEVIKAWADGKQIQYLGSVSGTWRNIVTPTWSKNTSYRVKPETIRYRVALLRTPDGVPFIKPEMDRGSTSFYIPGDCTFVRLLTDWTEVEV